MIIIKIFFILLLMLPLILYCYKVFLRLATYSISGEDKGERVKPKHRKTGRSDRR